MWYRLAKYIMCLVTLELIWKFLHSIEKYNCYQYLFTLEVIKSHTLKEKKKPNVPTTWDYYVLATTK